MIHWLHPAALLGLTAMVAPLLIHLLRRRRAPRLTFPSLRFILSDARSSSRLRVPADLPLLMLRMSIIGVAAVALAQPFWTSAARQHTWEMRLARAIVIDSRISASPQAKEAVLAATHGAEFVVSVATQSLQEGLLEAVDALADIPPSRREIVVVSTFRHGALSAADLAAVPTPVGVRFVSIEAADPAAKFSGDVLLAGPGIPSRVQRIELTPTRTAVGWWTSDDRSEGLRLETAANRAALLLRAVAAAGAPAPDVAHPIALAFHDSSKRRETLSSWMVQAVLRMRRDRELIDAARAHVPKENSDRLDGAAVARNAQDALVLSAFRSGTEMVLVLAAEPEDFLAAATVRSALVARRGPPGWNDHEVARIPRSQLVAWTREPAMPDIRNMHLPSPGDARFVWAVVLALLAAEAWIRRQRGHASEGRDAHAA